MKIIKELRSKIGKNRKVVSLTDIDSIHQIASSLLTFSNRDFMAFFRGHGKNSYKLLPTLCRDFELVRVHKKERQIINSVEALVNRKRISIDTRPWGIIAGTCERFWHMQMQMQHIGIKTKMIDWTIKMRVTAWFAVENRKHDNNDGHIWIFCCPKHWRYTLSNIDSLLNVHPLFFDMKAMINFPFAPTSLGDKRALSQMGRFFVQDLRSSMIPLEENTIYQPFLLKIEIPASHKRILREELIDINYSNHTIYHNQKPSLAIADCINDKEYWEYGIFKRGFLCLKRTINERNLSISFLENLLSP